MVAQSSRKSRIQRLKRITVVVPEDVLQRAQKATKSGATATVRKGLELLAATDVYDRLLKMRGKGGLGMTWQELRGKD